VAGEARGRPRKGRGLIHAPSRMLPSRKAVVKLGERTMNVKLYNTQRCPYARRTRIVLHEKGMAF
jgi:hypothetical protein